MRAFLLCDILSLMPCALAALATSTVRITNGTVQGLPANSAGIKTFLGIPFASPPVGCLRWQSPRPPAAFSSIYNATGFGASCYSADLALPVIGPVSEDCLTVNIWTGARSVGEQRPVMVWVYGGGFQFGSSNSPLYNGTHLAEQGVLVVTFNYRLGVFGFLGLTELDGESTTSGDYGLQDQLAALRWVKENIAAFGGDPDNVTIFGQSAGAHSVGLLLASPLSTGLFHKAIMESGAYWDSEHGSIRTFAQARAQGAAFQRQVGAASLADLRAISAQALNSAASWNASTDPGLTAFAPSIDNHVVPAAPAEAFDTGIAQKVPVLAGFNAAEQLAFLPRIIPHSTTIQYRQSAVTLFGAKTPRFLSLYPDNTQAQCNQSAAALLGDLIIREQTFEALDRQHSANHQSVYAYYYTYESTYSPQPIHTAEIYFVWGNLGFNPLLGNTSLPTTIDFNFSRSLMAYWTNFAKTGNPNNASAGLPDWPEYTGSGGDFLELGQDISAVPNPDAARFQFLSSLRVNGTLPTSWRSDFTNN